MRRSVRTTRECSATVASMHVAGPRPGRLTSRLQRHEVRLRGLGRRPCAASDEPERPQAMRVQRDRGTGARRRHRPGRLKSRLQRHEVRLRGLGRGRVRRRTRWCVRTGSAYLNVPWPALRTTAWHQETKEPVIRAWWGDLVDGMRDRSGQMYMRNRYYDPQTGQFTQTDPIGLRGGLNAYGFAAGDPVSYADPFGLCYFRIGPDYHYGRCGENTEYYNGDQERRPCTRNQLRACIEYPASERQWDRIGHKIRRLRTHTTYCRGAKEALLGLWNAGAACASGAERCACATATTTRRRASSRRKAAASTDRCAKKGRPRAGPPLLSS